MPTRPRPTPTVPCTLVRPPETCWLSVCLVCHFATLVTSAWMRTCPGSAPGPRGRTRSSVSCPHYTYMVVVLGSVSICLRPRG